MPRGATDGLLPELVEGHASRHPQPVLNVDASEGSSVATLPQQASQRPRIAAQHSFTTQAGSRRSSRAGSDSDDDGGLHMQRARGARPPPGRHASRAHSDSAHNAPRTSAGQGSGGEKEGKEGKFTVRHGWETQLNNQEQATLLNQNFFMYFEDKRHETAGNSPPEDDAKAYVSEWRMRDRLKTVSAILAVCLNVGTDPPDVIKTNPCARLECWVDPIPPETSSSQSSTHKTNAQIGKNLQSQYENLSLRTRYKVILDPTTDELKKYTTSLRRTAHAERILFHYNGHGVPKPTASGEIWCFNRCYTQYIPISLYDVMDWVGAPGLWVWDCSAAGGIITNFLDAAKKHHGNQASVSSSQQQPPPMRWDDCIHLAACRDDEVLPTNPQLPADIFTSCLTTPIAMAVRFFILQNPLPSTSNISLDTAHKIPGKVSERRTPLGELNWIFTAITDTIAWNCLSKPLFKKLFRQDLMVAALFRNFLLAQRIMRIYHCHPQSHPAIPDTHNHPLWQSWDLAVEMILAQLPKLVEQQQAHEAANEPPAQLPGVQGQAPPPAASVPAPQLELEYQHSDFFADQLSAFEVYLSSAPAHARAQGYAKPPEQLPIVLQVLLSQVHRLRALILLSKFLDLGPWAVNLALSIGIFPYVLKLLQSQAVELKPPMVFIWARILAVDSTCQSDLLKDSGYTYFTTILNSATGIPLGNVAEHRAMCAFVIAMFCQGFRQGQQAVLESNPEIIESCLQHLLDMENPLLRQFSCLCLGNLWRDFEPGKRAAMAVQAHARVRDRSHDPVPEVRAACLDALTAFVGVGIDDAEGVSRGALDAAVVLEEETLASVVVAMGMDGSIMVRKQLTVFYSAFLRKYEARTLVAVWEQLLEERDKRSGVEDEGGDVSPPPPPPKREVWGGIGVSGNGGGAYEEVTAEMSQQKDVSAVESLRNGGHGGNGGHQRSVSFTTNTTSASDSTATTLTGDDVAKPSRTLSKKTIYRAMWRQILSMSTDPHPEVARNAAEVVDYFINALLDSPLGAYANKLLDELVVHGLKDQLTRGSMDALGGRQRSGYSSRPQTPPSPTASTASKAGDGYFGGGLSRTASMAAVMKNFFSGAKTPTEAPTSPTRSHRGSIIGGGGGGPTHAYRSRPLTPGDAAMLPPDALDHQINGPPHQPKAKEPPSPFYTERDFTRPPHVPLQSGFFTWSASYFREPQMRPSEADEPGSLDYNERLWRRNRNDAIIASTQNLKDAAGSQPWDQPCGYFGVGAAPVKMVFHQFENHLVTSDDRDSIAVWDWADQRQLCRFSNGNPPGSRVTELRFINEDDKALLMTGSSDGVIRIFRGYEDGKTVQLASSFRALSDLVVSDRQNAGLVFDWQQGQGRILVAGDDRVIRVWQAGHELCVADIPARSGSCITSLTSDQVEGHVFVAGFGNGGVRVYDQRLCARDSMVMAWTDRAADHRSWIVGVHLQRGGLRELVSAESNGGIRLWDIRARAAVAALDGAAKQRSTDPPRSRNILRCLSVHEHAPVFATGSADHTIRVYNTRELSHLGSFEPYMSFLRLAASGPRNAPITATAFHPHRMMLACGAVTDGHVNLFRCEAREEGGGDGIGGVGKGVVEEWRG
ncbi:hypothetical protein LTR08_007720 [Meristemomyces frigidus]|nr:hypothetical protein LTR08_007720 [Meristemomyces frigidus]